MDVYPDAVGIEWCTNPRDHIALKIKHRHSRDLIADICDIFAVNENVHRVKETSPFCYVFSDRGEDLHTIIFAVTDIDTIVCYPNAVRGDELTWATAP